MWNWWKIIRPPTARFQNANTAGFAAIGNCLPWLFRHPPVLGGRAEKNPLSALSRWKIVDNLRRSLLEISICFLLLAGWFATTHQARWTLAVLLLMQIPAYVDMLISIIRAPERRFGKRSASCWADVFLRAIATLC